MLTSPFFNILVGYEFGAVDNKSTVTTSNLRKNVVFGWEENIVIFKNINYLIDFKLQITVIFSKKISLDQN